MTLTGPNPEKNVCVGKTYTPLTETLTDPPFHPSPQVSVIRSVKVHCALQKKVVSRNNGNSNNILILNDKFLLLT